MDPKLEKFLKLQFHLFITILVCEVLIGLGGICLVRDIANLRSDLRNSVKAQIGALNASLKTDRSLKRSIASKKGR